MFDNALTEVSLNLLRDFKQELTKFGFYLGGGSGLVLHFGHRVSESLDFYSDKKFDPELLCRYLETKTQYRELLTSLGTLYCTLSKVKISFNYMPAPLLYPVIKFENIIVADWKDILPEKFVTLSLRGGREDFYDIYACYILGDLKVREGLEILKRRFAGIDINFYNILKSLTYFDIGDKEPELILLKPIAWQTVKNFFLTDLNEFEKHLLIEEKEAKEEKKKSKIFSI